MTSDAKLTLQQFQQLSGFPDSLVVELLKANVLPLELDPQRGLLVDCSSLDVESLVREFYRARLQMVSDSRPLLREHLKAILARYFSELLAEAETIVAAEEAERPEPQAD